jgi:hypothetical protein
VRNLELVQASVELERLARLEMPVQAALRVRAMLRRLRDMAADIEAVRMSLLQRHAVVEGGEVARDERNQAVFPGAEAEEAFKAAYEELMMAEADLTGAPRLDAALLQGAAINVRASSLLALGELLEDDLDEQ